MSTFAVRAALSGAAIATGPTPSATLVGTGDFGAAPVRCHRHAHPASFAHR